MGGAMCKLLFRTLPEYYPEGSIYAQYVLHPLLTPCTPLTTLPPCSFPFVTPEEMQKHLRIKGILTRYKTIPPFTEPIPYRQSVNTYKGVQRVLGDMDIFKPVYGEAMDYLTNGHGFGFALMFTNLAKYRPAGRLVGRPLYKIEEWVTMYELKARELIETRSWGLTGVGRDGLGGSKYVDVVRDVLNVVPVYWICEEIVRA
jgi:linoleate 10R-lipoxygenase